MVHSSIADRFNEKFCAAVSGLNAGVPFGKNNITPLACSKTEYMQELVTDAKSKGAKVLNKSGGHMDRSLFFPSVLYPVQSSMKVWTEEQFGPVLPVAPYNSIEEVYDYLAKTNSGQQAAIFTSQNTKVPSTELTELLDVCALSTCRVNLNVQCSRGPDCYPFAGRRSSALGTISISEVLRGVSVETLVASKDSCLLERAAKRSKIFGKMDDKEGGITYKEMHVDESLGA
jgi:acyl-CoA reductase-like NAD-dependent aldehyde dehydrogenase